jgi:Tol biopolymer transport system component
MKLTSSPEANRFPLWTPDGKRIVFASGSDLVWMAADGTGPVETLLPGTAFRPRPAGWTSDQKLVYDFDDPEGDTFLLPVSGDRKPQPVVVSAFNNQRPALSPDRRWIAYQSSEAGRSAIYVRPFPLTESARWRISTGEGFSPIWSSDSRELFYNDSGQNAMLRVGIEGTSRFRASSPQVLFQREYFWGAAPYGRPYDLASDGRFLMIKPDSGTSEGLSPAVIVELNWDQELKRLVPTE